MLLYVDQLRKGETPLGRTEWDETLRCRDGGKGRVRGDGVAGLRAQGGRQRGAWRKQGRHRENIRGGNGIAVGPTEFNNGNKTLLADLPIARLIKKITFFIIISLYCFILDGNMKYL